LLEPKTGASESEPEKLVGDDAAQHAIAEKLKPFIIFRAERPVRERKLQ